MKRKIRKLITGIMTASILSQSLSGTVSMAAGIDGDSGSTDSAVVLEESVTGDEGEASANEAVEVSGVEGDNTNASHDEDNSETDSATGASDNDENSAKDDVNALSGQNNEEDLDVDTVSAKFSDDATSGVEGSEDDLSSDGSVSSNDNFMTVSFGDAGVVDTLDSEDESDNAKEESENNDDEISERGVLESELSGEPYIFDYDSFCVEWKIVSHWEGACNVSVSLTNKSEETIHNWNLSFLSEDEIINPYNARVTSEGSNGNKWTFKNAEYNQDIRSGESIQFGFQVKYGERIDIPFSYSIDSSEKKVSDADYEISDQIISSWDGGAVGELHIVNNKDTAIEDWTVTVRTDAVFLTVWGGNIKKVSEDTYEFSCPDYCQNIAPGQTAVIGYQLSGHDTAIEILGLKEWGNKDNTISGNSISDNSVNNNTISENSVSNNSVSDNSVSENKPVTYIESDGHQHIFIDSDEYELLEEGIYLLDVYSDSMTGYINYENEDQNDCDNENDNETKVESVKLEICDVFDETIWEG
nr:cellulose binding domain-containing protein [Lachnospiraceae bacterium]